jgi:uncharacterized protein
MVENRNQEESRDMSQKSRRGFAAMDPERQRQIASEGGRAAHKQGVAHEWSAEEARQAGRKGGQNSKGSRNHSTSVRGEMDWIIKPLKLILTSLLHQEAFSFFDNHLFNYPFSKEFNNHSN